MSFVDKKVLWINFRGSDAYNEIHEILYTMKISVRTVVQLNFAILFDYNSTILYTGVLYIEY